MGIRETGLYLSFDVAVQNAGTTVLNPAVDLTYDVTRFVLILFPIPR